ncbi:MAG TPA: hypothetical protein VGE66_01675 [Chitinophagaceae bacterium]
MKTVFLLALLYGSTCLAQNTIRIKAGTPLNHALSPAELYQYEAFRPGRIWYKDGHSSGGQLNYNRFFDEMQFISNRGDTLAVNNEPSIRFVAIEKDTFCYAGGFVRIMSATPTVKLAIKQWLKLQGNEKYGGYGQTYTSSAITSVSLLDDGKQTHRLTVKENILLTREVQYYFGDRWDHFLPATRKNVLELFAKHEDAVRQYLRERKVDFQKEEDLQALFVFLAKL